MSSLIIDLAYSALKVKSTLSEFSFANAIKIVSNVQALKDDKITVYDFEGKNLVIAEPTVSGEILYKRDFDFLVEYAPVLVAHALRTHRKKQAVDHPGVPPVHFTHLKIGIPFENCKNGSRAKLIERLSRFIVDGREHRFEVEALPQGVGVFLEYLHEAKPTDRTESGFVLDFGFNTVLLVGYQDLKPRHAESEQLDHYGLSRVIERLAGDLQRQFSLSLPLIEVNRIFRDRYLDDCGERHDISDLCDKAVSEYLAQIFLELFDKKADKFRKVQKLVIGGGGAYYITPASIPERYRKMVHIMPNQPEFSNVRGFMRLEDAAKRAEQQAV